MRAKIFRSWRLALGLGVMIATGVLGTPVFAEDATNDATTNAPPPPVVTQPATTTEAEPLPSVPLTSTAAEVVKLAQAGMGEDVLLAYIGATKNHFSLGSDQIVYLNDVGISGTVVKAMIQRDAAEDADAAMVAAANVPPPVPDTTAPPAPPDDSLTPVGPPPNDSGAPATADNPGDYATSDDTAYFYDSLAPYGSWVYVAGGGLCWQPTVYVVDRSWRPYSDRGRWVYTDCGWYWQSDYSWGWGPFHYGRWFRDTARGWVWAPNRVWAPAWVSWRHSADYCGWAPLPPAAKFAGGIGFRAGNTVVGANYEFGLTAHRYIFIPIERMTDAAPARYSLLPDKSAELFQETQVANNFKVENNRVVNRNIDAQRVAEVSGTEVRQAQIRDLPRTAHGNKTPSERMGKQDDTLVIYRPQLPKPDLNYAKKPTSTVATTGLSRVTGVGNNSAILGTTPNSFIPGTSSQPLVLRGPTVAAAAARSKVDNQFVVLVPPDLHNERPASAPLPAAAYPPNSLVWSGPQYNYPAGQQPVGAYSPALPPVPDPAYGQTDPQIINQYYQGGTFPGRPERREHPYGDVTHHDQPQLPATSPMPMNNYSPPQSHNSQSSILTPPHYNASPAPAPAQSYQAPASPVNHPAPIYTPPAYQHSEPAPAPVYHAPPTETHSAPVESHSAPPAETHSSPPPAAPSPSSSSSSSSSNSGHR